MELNALFMKVFQTVKSISHRALHESSYRQVTEYTVLRNYTISRDETNKGKVREGFLISIRFECLDF